MKDLDDRSDTSWPELRDAVLGLLALMLIAGLYEASRPSGISSNVVAKEQASPADPFAPRTYVIPPGPEAAFALQERMINSVPGDVIQLEAGTYQFEGQLDVTCANLTIRGRGQDKTVLSFRGQNVGSEGLVATGDAFVIEDLAIEDSVGNAIKVLGADGVVFRRVRTEWTRGPHADNGAYGIYPVQCKNVLIEDCIAIAASDAGVYVGQSEDVIVRGCRAEQNVAGIEIENTLRADVYDNVAINNTGGVLVFDLPGLQLTNGGQVRVFRNRIVENNTAHFAPPGNMVASVPSGCGLMVMATDDVEVFDNEIADNNTVSVLIVSFLVTERPIKDAKYDPFPENISVHNNRILRGGGKPSGALAGLLAGVMGQSFPQVFYDGIRNPKTPPGSPPEVKLSNNGKITFANGNLADLSPQNILTGKYQLDQNLSAYTATSKALPEVKLAELPAPPENGNPAVRVYRETPQSLSAWKLFEGDPVDQKPAEGVFRYDLNTPLYSDDTAKHRFIRLPDGQPMQYQPESVFEFPVGTVIAKTFAMPHDMRDESAGQQLLETRIEEHRPDGWYGFSYIWNDDQTDARLALGGGSLMVEWIDAHGMVASNEYQIPNANQCITCHGQSGKFQPIGPTAANLNRLFEYSEGNQLAHWSAHGQLANAPDDVPAWPVFDDASSGTLSERARAWLHVNCSHCHNPTGSARTSGLDLTIYQQDAAKYGVWKSPVATGRGSGGRKFDIVPGKPDESILVYRMESDEPGIRMPNLARNMTHGPSIDLIREWIASMPQEADSPVKQNGDRP